MNWQKVAHIMSFVVAFMVMLDIATYIRLAFFGETGIALGISVFGIGSFLAILSYAIERRRRKR